MNILNYKKGDTFRKGKRTRIFLGMYLFMVMYKTPSSNKIIYVRTGLFNKWLEGAEKI